MGALRLLADVAGAPVNVPEAVLRWRVLIQDHLAEYWPALLEADGERWILAQLWQESAGDPRAQSSAGAVGLMQLMPATAREVGVEDRTDPIQSIRGGVIYLKRQYDRLPDRNFATSYPHVSRLLLALASYNAGRGYIEAALRLQTAAGDPEWWTWRSVSEAIPSAKVRGRTAIVRQVRGYVAGIVRRRAAIVEEDS